MIVSIGDWEKNTRLYAKTSVWHLAPGFGHKVTKAQPSTLMAGKRHKAESKGDTDKLSASADSG
jgi:hypothetical protein